MKNTLAIVLIMFLAAAPSRLLAKEATTKVVIEGPDLSKPIEITDRKILGNFNVWAEPGTFSTQPGFNANASSFIIDWSQAPIAEAPKVLQRYQTSFYSGELSERRIYVVYYAVARSSEPGYLYLPGKSEEWWRLNVRSQVLHARKLSPNGLLHHLCEVDHDPSTFFSEEVSSWDHGGFNRSRTRPAAGSSQQPSG